MLRTLCLLTHVTPLPPHTQVLLRKLSNAIIVRCAAVISLEDVFSGQVIVVRVWLRAWLYGQVIVVRVLLRAWLYGQVIVVRV